MAELLDRAGLAAGLETAGVAWRELTDAERAEFAVDGVAPSAICWPITPEEAARALAVADRLGLKVSPRGAGTKIGLGNPPRGCDIIVSTERLAEVVDYAPANLTVTVQAGVRLATVQSQLGNSRQFLPIDPPFADRATIGGVLATNANGPRRLGYGSVRDLVIGTRSATASGKVVKSGGRVVKNVAGYDLNKLYVGSLGTLVLLVEASFKVAPLPTEQTTVVGHFANLAGAAEASRTILHSPLLPSALDLLNSNAVKRLGAPALASAGFILAALGTAPGGALGRQGDDFARIFREAGATNVTVLSDSDEFWNRVSESSGDGIASGTLSMRISVPLADVATAIGAIQGADKKIGASAAVTARAGTGVIFADWNDLSGVLNGQSSLVANVLTEVRASVQKLGGALVVESCPRELKERLDIWGDVGPAIGVMRRLKAALDPNGTLNPGRFVGGI